MVTCSVNEELRLLRYIFSGLSCIWLVFRSTYSWIYSMMVWIISAIFKVTFFAAKSQDLCGRCAHLDTGSSSILHVTCGKRCLKDRLEMLGGFNKNLFNEHVRQGKCFVLPPGLQLKCFQLLLSNSYQKKIIGEIDVSVIRVQPKQMFIVRAGCLHHFQASVLVHSKHSGLEQNSGLLGDCAYACAYAHKLTVVL